MPRKDYEETQWIDKDDEANKELRESYNIGLTGFIKYFERTYIGKIGEEGRNKPMFRKDYL